jgi:hypothetical protein
MLGGRDGARSLHSPMTKTRPSIVQLLGMVAALQAAPVIVVLIVTGHLPVVGLVVSSALLLVAMWLVLPPRISS